MQKSNVKYVDPNGVINPVSGGVGQAIDGFTIAATDTVLLIHPPNGDAYAGPWVANAGAWTRATDWDTVGEISLGDWWYVEKGAEYQGTIWHFDDDAVPTTLNTDLLTISQLTRRRALEQGSGIDISGTTPPLITWTAPSDVASTFLEGLGVEFLSATSLRVKAGACYIPATGVADLDTDLDLTGLTFTANTWYYLYAYDAGGGVLAVDPPSTQAPVTTPYRDNARIKGPDVGQDSTRRLIKCFRATATNTIGRYTKVGNLVMYGENPNTTLALFSGLTNTAATNRDLSPLVPPISRRALVSFEANASAGVYVDPAPEVPSGFDWHVVVASGRVTVPVPLTSAQNMRERNTAASGSTSIIVMGFYEEL